MTGRWVCCGLILLTCLLSRRVLAAEARLEDVTLSEGEKEQFVGRKVDSSGHAQHSFNIELFDRKLEAAWWRAANYPPEFITSEEREQTERLVQFLAGLVEVLNQLFESSGEMALRAARVYSMAYNLDIHEINVAQVPAVPFLVGERAVHYYERALSFTPEDPYVHWHYGAFLASVNSNEKIQQGLTHLERAVELGLVPARYSLGVTSIQVGDTQRAAEELEAYLKYAPADEKARKLLEAIRGGGARVEVKRGFIEKRPE